MLYAEQMKASFIRRDVKEYINNNLSEEERKRIYDLFEYDSYFDMVSNFIVSKDTGNAPEFIKNIAKVAQNIIQRGFPTSTPKFLDNAKLDFSEIDEKKIRESLILYDRNFTYKNAYNYMEKTADGIIKKANVNNTEIALISSMNPRLAQFVEMQKPLEDVIEYPNTDIKKYENYTRFVLNFSKQQIKDTFSNQRLDFALQLPGEHCLNIEFDGPTHDDVEQKYLDKKRDGLLESLLWKSTLRVTDIEDAEINKRTEEIFISAFGNSSNDQKELSCITMPLFSARMAKIFLYLIEKGHLRISSKNPVYLYIETDENYKLYNLTIKFCLELLYNLLLLTNKENPQISKICIRYKTKGKIIDCSVSYNNIEAGVLHTNFKNTAYIIIKDQMRRRFCYMNMDGYNDKNNKKVVWLLSSYCQWSDYQLRTSDKHIKYNIEDDDKPVLEFFLYNIFGKEHFRPKQFEIVQTALNRQNVIGLLPTGSGKSITFQLPALLQPMPSIVIAPLVSLMEDQVHNLISNGITNVVSINSSKSVDEKQMCLNKVSNNSYSFIYSSPERFQILSFRTIINNMKIGYVILDEAHCVSQWGHDFRTSYLRVGDTIKKYASDAVIMALTGTASSNVITDIKRELHMNKKVSIISTDNFRRNELHFKVFKKKRNSSLKDTVNAGIINLAVDEAIKDLAKAYSKNVNEYMLPTKNGYENAGIIFNPYANTLSTIYKNLSQADNLKGIKIGKYSGQLTNSEKEESQKQFIENKTGILVATKAFGMGIDKPNIRFTVHTCVPESIEAFYQEAGRAGRDGNYSVNIIIAPPDNTTYDDSKDKEVYRFFINQSFPEIEKIKEAMRALVFKKNLYIKKHSFVLLEDLAVDGSIPSNIELVVTNRNKQDCAELILGNSNGLKFNIAIDNIEKKVKMFFVDRQDYDERIKNNVVLDYYIKHVINEVRKKIRSAAFVESDDLKKYINTCTNEYKASIVDCVKTSLEKGEPTECFIRLDSSVSISVSINNPVEKLFENLFSVANIPNNELVMTEGERIIVDKITESINQKIINNKYDVYAKISAIKNSFSQLEYHYYNILKRNDLFENFKDSYSEIYNAIGMDDEEISLDMSEPNIDVDKLLYYLGVVGVYSNYERDYGKNTIKLQVEPITKESLKKNIKKHLSGYETADYVERIIKKLDIFDNIDDKDIEGLMTAATDYIIDYSYDKIREYRAKQTENMYKCIEDSEKFTDNIYQYFEAKYYTDLYDDIANENVLTALKWIKKIEGSEDIDNNTRLNLDDLSHLRSSAMKCRAARPQAYTPYLLVSYCMFRDTDLSIKDGLEEFLKGVEKLSILRTNYQKMIGKFAEWCLNTNDKRYLEEVMSFIEKDFTNQNKDILKVFTDVIYKKLFEEQNLFITEEVNNY